MPGKVPDRWDAYDPMGERIPGTRFIAFKVPLHEHMCRNMSEQEKFTVPHLIRHMEDSEQELGLVIDLTNTTRYYNYEDIEKHNIQYHKVLCPGKIIPPKDVRAEFFQIVDNFLQENSGNDKLIGVHCTHGLNRSGHLVCRYMIDRLNMTPEDAISRFNEARGHNMEREHYIDDLKSGKSHEASDFVEPINPAEVQVHGYGKKHNPRHQGRGSSSSSRRQNTYSNDSYQHNGHFNRDQNRPFNSGYDRPHAPYNSRHGDTWGSQSNPRGRGRQQSNRSSNGSSYGQYGRSYGADSSYNSGRTHGGSGSYGQFGRSHGSEGGYGRFGRSHGAEAEYGQFGRSRGAEGGYGQFGRSHDAEGGYGQYGRPDYSHDSEGWTTVQSRNSHQRDRNAHPYGKSRNGP